MKAFMVHDSKKQLDFVIIPEKDILLGVDAKTMADFIAVQPGFAHWAGSSLNGLPPHAFGRLVATREENEDVCIVEPLLWQQRMLFHLAGS